MLSTYDCIVPIFMTVYRFCKLFNADLCSFAAGGGNLETLKYLREVLRGTWEWRFVLQAAAEVCIFIQRVSAKQGIATHTPTNPPIMHAM